MKADEKSKEVAQEVTQEVAQEVTQEVAQEVTQEVTQKVTQKVAQEEETAEKTKKIFIRRPADERGVKAKIVGLNGKMYSVPYDREVEVPEEVANILERSEAAQNRAAEAEIEAMSRAEKMSRL